MSIARNLSKKYKKQFFDTASEKVVHKAAEAIEEFLWNKITDAVANSYGDGIVKTKPVEKIINPPEKREEIL